MKDWQRLAQIRERQRDRDAINRLAGRRFKIVYEVGDSGQTGTFAYCHEAHGGTWLRIAQMLEWVRNARVIPV